MHVKSFVVCTDAKMAQDGVKVFWCYSSSAGFLKFPSLYTCTCFHSENLYVTCSCQFFCLFVCLCVCLLFGML